MPKRKVKERKKERFRVGEADFLVTSEVAAFIGGGGLSKNDDDPPPQPFAIHWFNWGKAAERS